MTSSSAHVATPRPTLPQSPSSAPTAPGAGDWKTLSICANPAIKACRPYTRYIGIYALFRGTRTISHLPESSHQGPRNTRYIAPYTAAVTVASFLVCAVYLRQLPPKPSTAHPRPPPLPRPPPSGGRSPETVDGASTPAPPSAHPRPPSGGRSPETVDGASSKAASRVCSQPHSRRAHTYPQSNELLPILPCRVYLGHPQHISRTRVYDKVLAVRPQGRTRNKGSANKCVSQLGRV